MPLKRTVRPGYTKKHARVAALSAMRRRLVVVDESAPPKRLSKLYTPNGTQECARRVEQMKRGII